MIYLDNNATTPLAPEAFDAMRPFLDANFGNPSSNNPLGRDARKAIGTARENVAALLGAPNAEDVIFTASGTEADNWAVRGALEASQGNHIVTTRVEHEAVRKLCQLLEQKGTRVSWLDVDERGALDLDQLRSELSAETAVVSAMLANNESGVLFPVKEIGEVVRSNSRALFHVDAVNAAGKVPLNVGADNIDLLSISGHKFHGPKGIGALYVRKGVELPPVLIGGGQESGRRAGTEAVHQIAGVGAAAAIAADLTTVESVRQLRDLLEERILSEVPNSRVNGTTDPNKRLPNTSNISFENTNGEMILHQLDAAGVCVSTGSACNSADHRASAVLEAMNVPYSFAMGSIRFSLGRYNTADEVKRVAEIVPQVLARLRSAQAAFSIP